MVKTRLITDKDNTVVEQAKCDQCFKWVDKAGNGVTTYFSGSREEFTCMDCWKDKHKEPDSPLISEDLEFSHREFSIMEELVKRVQTRDLPLWIKDLETDAQKVAYFGEIVALERKIGRITKALSDMEKEKETNSATNTNIQQHLDAYFGM